MADAKEFSLKEIETQLLYVFQQQQSVLLSNILSFIAIERLAVTVDGNTRFELSPDYKKITITQVEPEAEAGVIETAPVKGKK